MYEGRVGIYWGGTFGPERKPRAVIEPITQLPSPHPLSPSPSPEYKEEFVKYFRRQSAVLDTKLVSHVSFKLHFSKKSLCFTFRFTCQSPSLIFTVSPPPLQLLCTPIPHQRPPTAFRKSGSPPKKSSAEH